MLFIFIKSYFWLRNNCSLISINRAFSSVFFLASADGQLSIQVGWCLHQQMSR